MPSKQETLEAARRAVALVAGKEMRHSYMSGKNDSMGVVRACVAAIELERDRAAHAAHAFLHDNVAGLLAPYVALAIYGREELPPHDWAKALINTVHVDALVSIVMKLTNGSGNPQLARDMVEKLREDRQP